MLMLLLLLGCPRNKTENNKCQGPGRSDLPGMLLNWNLMSLELFTNTSDPEGRNWLGANRLVWPHANGGVSGQDNGQRTGYRRRNGF